MSEYAHIEPVRRRPEVFGISTLDTVTCALGAAIILMILMAVLTPRAAEVVLTPHRQILQSGEAELGSPAERNPAGVESDPEMPADLENLLVVFYSATADRNASDPAIKTIDCPNTSLNVRVLRSPREHFESDKDENPVAYAIWAEGKADSCEHFSLTPDGLPNGSCDVVLVSAAHFQTRTLISCKEPINFKSNGDKIYRLGWG